MLVPETVPRRSISSPSESLTRSFWRGTTSAPSTLATSSLIVFEPTSTTPIRIGTNRRSPVGGRVETRPRRVSGPVRGRAERSSPAVTGRRPSVAARGLLVIRGLPEHALLDRIVRGRVWIPLLGVLLVGIVAMQVEILKLGAGMGRSSTAASTDTASTTSADASGNTGAGATGNSGAGATGNTGAGATGNSGAGATGNTGAGATGNSGASDSQSTGSSGG